MLVSSVGGGYPARPRVLVLRARQAMETYRLEVATELPAGGAVDEDVAGVVRDADLLDNLPRREVSQVALPGGVRGHGLQGHLLPEGDAGLHGERDGHRKLGDDEVERDPHERDGGGDAARAGMHVVASQGAGGLGDVQAAYRADLAQHADVEDQSDDGHQAEHDDLRGPVPKLVDAFQVLQLVRPHLTLPRLRAD